jgi:carbonic anhydrase
MISGREALSRLRVGNERFAAGRLTGQAGLADRREVLKEQQAPFAIILGCSDSRVPAEMIFDQGLGDLFVIRVAGNVTQPSQIGSVEYAATTFGTRLVVILGHSRCGAIEATMRRIAERHDVSSPNLRSIVEFVRPSVEPLLEAGSDDDPDSLIGRAVRANVRASVERMRQGSDVLGALERQDRLLIVGAEYSLDTGLVDFFHSIPGEH